MKLAEPASEYFVLAILGMIIGCYLTSFNKIIGSNCTQCKICFGLCAIKRKPLTNEQAIEIMEHRETIEAP